MIKNETLSIQTIVKVMEDMKAEEITVLNVNKFSSLCDVMIICTASSARHMNGIAREIAQYAKPFVGRTPDDHGPADTGWLLLDLGDIIVHIMLEEARNHYRLENLWEDNNQMSPQLNKQDT